jgi:hypothetical protein
MFFQICDVLLLSIINIPILKNMSDANKWNTWQTFTSIMCNHSCFSHDGYCKIDANENVQSQKWSIHNYV